MTAYVSDADVVEFPDTLTLGEYRRLRNWPPPAAAPTPPARQRRTPTKRPGK